MTKKKTGTGPDRLKPQFDKDPEEIAEELRELDQEQEEEETPEEMTPYEPDPEPDPRIPHVDDLEAIVVHRVRKKPVIVRAFKLNQETRFTTLNGPAVAQEGDWAIIGPNGEKYPCPKDVFKDTYDLVGEKEPPPRHTPQVFLNKNKAVFCWVFNCRKPAEWFLGRPDGPNNLLMPVCSDCLVTLAETMPEPVEYKINAHLAKVDQRPLRLGYRCPNCGEAFEEYGPWRKHMNRGLCIDRHDNSNLGDSDTAV